MSDKGTGPREESSDSLKSGDVVDNQLLLKKDIRIQREHSDTMTVATTLTTVTPLPQQRPDLTQLQESDLISEQSDTVADLKPTSGRSRASASDTIHDSQRPQCQSRKSAATPERTQSQSAKSDSSERAHDYIFTPANENIKVNQFYPEIEIRLGAQIPKSEILIDAAEEDSLDEEDREREENEANKELVEYEQVDSVQRPDVDLGDYDRPDSALTDVTIADEFQVKGLEYEPHPTNNAAADLPRAVYTTNDEYSGAGKNRESYEGDEFASESMSLPRSTPGGEKSFDVEPTAFTTEVDEEAIDGAKQRQGKKKGRLFNPEEWTKREETIVLPTMKDIVGAAVNEHIGKGMLNMRKLRCDEAIRNFNKALNLQPNIALCYCQKGEAYLQLCDFQSAIMNYKKACVLEPGNSDYYARLAFLYYFQGQCLFDQKLYPEALESFSRAAEMRTEIVGYHTRRFPKHASYSCAIRHVHIRNQHVACLAALQRHGECLALVNKRLEEETSNPDLYIMRARLHEMFRNLTLCFYDVKDALSLDPEHQEALKMKAKLAKKSEDSKQHAVRLNLQGKYRDALQKISTAIEADPTIANFHILRGALHRRLNDFNAAIDDFLLALDKTDHDEEHPVYVESQRQLLLTYNDFAVECFQKSYYDEAIVLLNKAIKGEKREKGLYVNRGDCFYRQREFSFALADYHQALDLDPADQAIKSRVAVIHNDYGNTEYNEKNYLEAETRFTLAIQHNGRIGQYYLSRARTRFMMEELAGARQDILYALHLDPKNEEILSILSRLFPGKTITDVIHSPAAEGVKTALELDRVPKATPVADSTEDSEDNIADVPQPEVEGTSFWKAGFMFPSIRACMEEQEFHSKILKGKKKVNTRLKAVYHERKTLRYKGVRLRPLPDPVPFARQGGPSLKKDIPLGEIKEKSQSTGWKKFTMGIGLLNST